ncbi:MFS transporter [Fundidesulfovibrio soli]|uniref:MFS transporter n=1 Tax=Fundidesulfovibrio soli TaxID=2922716 RepID=UPI001FAF2CEC|nr:MFS transporter [Fundidesulfovibrio soli]
MNPPNTPDAPGQSQAQDQAPTTLFSFGFIGLCLLIFLAYCNITVYYSLYVHLANIGIPEGWRGFLIGSSSLATIACYLVLSPFMTRRRAAACAIAGALTLMACGSGYLFLQSPGGILALRLANGLGIYLIMAASMTLLVSLIPSGRSGQAFGLYSVAILLPYSIVPSVFDALGPRLGSLANGYTIMSLCLVPAMAVVFVVGRRRKADSRPEPSVSLRDMYANAARPRIALLLCINALYIVGFSSMFFMAKGFFESKGFQGVGFFFTMQMVCMIVLRLMANRLFDRVRKLRLVRLSFALTAAGFVMLTWAQGLGMVCASALLLGVGMGLSSPALYGLMFTISDERYRAVNSNLMTMSLQTGSFLGPMIGSEAVHLLGYAHFPLANAAVILAGAAVSFIIVARRFDPDGAAARA